MWFVLCPHCDGAAGTLRERGRKAQTVFPAAVVPVANSGVVMVGEGPFSFLALAVVDKAPDGADLVRRVQDRPDLAARDRATGPTTASSAVGPRRTSPYASSVR